MIRPLLIVTVLLLIGCEKEVREAKAPVDLDRAALAQVQGQ